jgi:hypothetical protein
MDARTFADTIMKISSNYNIKNDNIKDLVLKITVVSLKYIDKHVLWERTFSDGYVDWDLIKLQKDNILGGIIQWIHLLDMREKYLSSIPC